MSTGRFVAASAAGGVAVFVMGFLIYGLATASFFEANQGSAVGVMRETPDFVHLFLGQLAFGTFLTIAIGKWARVAGAAAGLQIGAIVGLVVGLGVDLTMFGVTNTANITATLVDPILWMIQMGIGGAVVGAVIGAGK
jgi:hypothetical protein